MFLKKRQLQKKSALNQKIELLCTLCIAWGFKKIPFTLCTYVLARILQTDSWFQKSHEEFGQLQASIGKSKKLKSDGLHLPKKHIPSAKTLYTEIYLTLLSTTCVKIHQITFYIFETISYFSRRNSPVLFQLKHYILSTKVAH